MLANERLILALPKGRLLTEALPLVRRAGIALEPAFDDPDERQLRFRTDDEELDVIRVRAFDVPTYVAFGAADLGVAGSDVMMEFDYPEIYAPLDLGIGACRLVVAGPKDDVRRDDLGRLSRIRIATKYPGITRQYFAARGVQAECITLNGAVELAPGLGLSRQIVDLVQTGSTLKANNLVEIEQIAAITARLIVNRTALKTRTEQVKSWIQRFREAADAG